MKKFLYYLPSIIFNLLEVLVSILVGYLLKAKIEDMILIILLFNLIRNMSKQPIHYKNPILCFVWTVLFYTSLFLVSRLGLKIYLICTIFSAMILTNKGNIFEVFKNSGQWGGNLLNKEVFDWVKFNPDNELLRKYEKDLYNKDKTKYYIFKYRFREFKTYDEIADLMEKDKQRISDEIKIMSHFIEYSIRLNESE